MNIHKIRDDPRYDELPDWVTDRDDTRCTALAQIADYVSITSGQGLASIWGALNRGDHTHAEELLAATCHLLANNQKDQREGGSR